MNFTFLNNANSQPFGLFGILTDQSIPSFYGIVFDAVVLTLLGCWLVLNWLQKKRDCKLDEKEIIRRRRLGLSLRFTRRSESSTKAFRRSVLVSGVVVTCLFILTVKEACVGDGFAFLISNKTNSSLDSKLSCAVSSDEEKTKQECEESSDDVDIQILQALSSLNEQIKKQTEASAEQFEAIQVWCKQNARTCDNLAARIDKTNNMVYVTESGSKSSSENEPQKQEEDEQIDEIAQEEIEDETRDSCPGTIAFVPWVGDFEASSENVSRNTARSPEKSRADSVYGALTGEKNYVDELPIADSDAFSTVAVGLNDGSSVAPNELRISEPIQADLLNDLLFYEKVVAKVEPSLAAKFREYAESSSLKRRLVGAGSNRIRMAGAESLSGAPSNRAGLIRSNIDSRSLAIPSDLDENMSLLEKIDYEANQISASVRSCVLPIVTIKSTSTPQKIEEETGCSFLVAYGDKTLAVTNYHVVSQASSNESIKVFLPNKQIINPRKVLFSQDFDIALLELDPNKLPHDGSLTYCTLGDSDTLQVANAIFAFGSPFGLEKSVTYGHVSSLHRCNRDLIASSQNNLAEYIQIDAAINPGNSGGPLYNARGEVIGVVTAIATTTGKNEGVAFAIPSNILMRVVKVLVETGEWRRSRLGIEMNRVSRSDLSSTNLTEVFGAKVKNVQPRSPASIAGLRSGDVILAFNGQPIFDDAHLARLIALAEPSEKARLSVLRGKQFFELSASPILSRVTAN